MGDKDRKVVLGEARPMNIGEQRRTIYVEPIEDPATAPVKEPSPEVLPEHAEPHPEEHPVPTP